MYKLYMKLVFVISVLMCLFTLTFNMRGISEVTHDGWLAILISFIVLILTSFSLIKIPVKFLKNLLTIEILSFTLFLFMMKYNFLIPRHVWSLRVVLNDITILVTIFYIIFLVIAYSEPLHGKKISLDTISQSFYLLVISNLLFELFPYGITVMDNVNSLQIGKGIQNIFLIVMNLHLILGFIGIIMMFGMILSLVLNHKGEISYV